MLHFHRVGREQTCEYKNQPIQFPGTKISEDEKNFIGFYIHVLVDTKFLKIYNFLMWNVFDTD